jgi:hypothetical protein
MKKYVACVVFSVVSLLVACADDGTVLPSGEGEGDVGEGEGEAGEGEGEAGEGEGETGEGEGEVDTVVLGDRANPSDVEFPFAALVTVPAEGACVSLVVAAGEAVSLDASTASAACMSSDEDTLIVVYNAAGEVVARNDDGGGGYCSDLNAVLGEGTYAVCLESLGGDSLGPTTFTVDTSPLTVVGVGGACTPSDLCDPALIDRTGDSLVDPVTCIDQVCTVVVQIPEGGACTPNEPAEACAGGDRVFLQCLSFPDGESRCAVQVFLRGGEPCAAGVTSSVCDFELVCGESGTCETSFLESCLAATEVSGTTIEVDLTASSVSDAYCLFDGGPQTALTYFPDSRSVLAFSSDDAVLSVRPNCNELYPTCVYDGEEAPREVRNASGEPMSIFVQGLTAGQSAATVTVTEIPFVEKFSGEACDTFASDELCVEDGERCNGGICATPDSIAAGDVVDTVPEAEFVCYRVQDPGSYTAATAGACETDADYDLQHSLEAWVGDRRITYGSSVGMFTCSRVNFTVGEQPVDVCVQSFAASLFGLQLGVVVRE